MHASTMHRPAHWSDAWMPACAGMTVEGAKRSGAQHAPSHAGARLTAPACAWAAARRRAKPCRSLAV